MTRSQLLQLLLVVNHTIPVSPPALLAAENIQNLKTILCRAHIEMQI